MKIDQLSQMEQAILLLPMHAMMSMFGFIQDGVGPEQQLGLPTKVVYLQIIVLAVLI